MSDALAIMRQRAQAHLPWGILPGSGGRIATMLIDLRDLDGRVYRLEFQSTLDGQHAVAIIRYNPWTRPGQGPAAGESYTLGHVSPSGFICLGGEHPSESVTDSPYALDWAIRRVEYFVSAFSRLKETGTFPQPRSGGRS